MKERHHNTRADITAGSCWAPFLRSDRFAALVVVQETPAPDAERVRVVSRCAVPERSGRRYSTGIRTLLAQYYLTTEAPHVEAQASRPAVEVDGVVFEAAAPAPASEPVPDTEAPPPAEPERPAADVIVRMVDGWRVSFVDGDDEPRMADLDLGERLGYARPRDIRKLIKDLVIAEKLNDIHHRDGATRWPGQVAARPERTYYLTEAQALKVAAKAETEPADKLLDEMIAVYQAARRGELPASASERAMMRISGELAGLANGLAAQQVALVQLTDTVANLAAHATQAPGAVAPQPPTEEKPPAGWKTARELSERFCGSLGASVPRSRVDLAARSTGVRDRSDGLARQLWRPCIRGGKPRMEQVWFYAPELHEELEEWVVEHQLVSVSTQRPFPFHRAPEAT